MRVGFIGTGEIAAAMVAGLAGQGHEIHVSQRNAQRAAALAAQYPGVSVAANAKVVERSDIVVLCLLADVAGDVLPDLPWRADHRIISVMVDVDLATLARDCAPAREIALTIPLSSIATGGSVLPVHPKSEALSALYGETNTLIDVPTERGLNAHFAASALSAPILAQMRSGAAWLGEQTGDPEGAQAYVAGVFAAFLRQMQQSDAGFDELLDGLMTEGGLNATLRQHMADAGAPDALTGGLDLLKERLGL